MPTCNRAGLACNRALRIQRERGNRSGYEWPTLVCKGCRCDVMKYFDSGDVLAAWNGVDKKALSISFVSTHSDNQSTTHRDSARFSLSRRSRSFLTTTISRTPLFIGMNGFPNRFIRGRGRASKALIHWGDCCGRMSEIAVQCTEMRS